MIQQFIPMKRVVNHAPLQMASCLIRVNDIVSIEEDLENPGCLEVVVKTISDDTEHFSVREDFESVAQRVRNATRD